MKAKALNGITEIKRSGISVRIRSIIKDGTTYYVLDDRVAGKRKLVWRSTLADARAAADEAIDKITEGQAEALNLKSTDAHAYTRARTALEWIENEVDHVSPSEVRCRGLAKNWHRCYTLFGLANVVIGGRTATT